MPNTIGTDNTDVVVLVCPNGIVSDSSAAHLYDAEEVWTSGDALPSDLGRMMGGTFTAGGVYTAAVLPDWADRNRAWTEALTDWIDNGTMSSDDKWQRCVKSGDQGKGLMLDADWTAIIAAYPA